MAIQKKTPTSNVLDTIGAAHLIWTAARQPSNRIRKSRSIVPCSLRSGISAVQPHGDIWVHGVALVSDETLVITRQTGEINGGVAARQAASVGGATEIALSH